LARHAAKTLKPCISGCGFVVLLRLIFAQQFEDKAVKAVLLRHVFPTQLSVTVPAELNLPSIPPEPGISVRDPLNANASGSIAITTQPDDVTIIGEIIMVAASHIHLFRDRGDKVAAGSADKPPLPEVLILFMLEERGPLVQVGQVVHVLLGGVLP
jgi:hypothetical protein